MSYIRAWIHVSEQIYDPQRRENVLVFCLPEPYLIWQLAVTLLATGGAAAANTAVRASLGVLTTVLRVIPSITKMIKQAFTDYVIYGCCILEYMSRLIVDLDLHKSKYCCPCSCIDQAVYAFWKKDGGKPIRAEFMGKEGGQRLSMMEVARSWCNRDLEEKPEALSATLMGAAWALPFHGCSWPGLYSPLFI